MIIVYIGDPRTRWLVEDGMEIVIQYRNSGDFSTGTYIIHDMDTFFRWNKKAGSFQGK